MSGASAVAAMYGRIVRAFAGADAFSEASAKSPEDLGLRFHARGIFSRMERRGEIIKTNDGRYYMDKAYYDARQRRIRIVAPIAAVVLIVVVVCLLVFTR